MVSVPDGRKKTSIGSVNPPSHPEIAWVIEGKLARGCRPGRFIPEASVDESVTHWIEQATGMGIKTIVCLLSTKEIETHYLSVGIDLLSRYHAAGFTVIHIPVNDHRSPPIEDDCLRDILEAIESAAEPMLIHCSAGIDRTGAVISAVS